MAGKRYTFPADQWRLIAQKFAGEVLNAVTGQSGYFDTKLAYEVLRPRP